jgi:hypothetical protein
VQKVFQSCTAQANEVVRCWQSFELPQFVTNNSKNGKQLHTALSARLVELEAAAPNFQRNRPLTGYKLFDLVTESQIAALATTAMATAAPPTTPPNSSCATTPSSSSNVIPPTTQQ